MAVTMQDVATKAQVSTATVSRALMLPEKVALDTRLRVEQAAMELGYLPPAINRHLKQNRLHTVLVMVPDINNPFYHDMLRGIETTATGQGYLVLIGDCAYQEKPEKRFIDFITSKDIVGVLLLGGQLSYYASKEEKRHFPPIVLANEFSPDSDLPSVHVDNLTASFKAVNYLYELGHTRVACISGPEESALCQYRLQGYIQALTRNGQTFDPNYIVKGEFSYQTGARAIAKLLALPKPPTALFCHSDILALGALFAAKRCGLRVPHDLSIIGFDNSPITEFSDPPLTTVEQPGFQMGQEAMLLLIERMMGKSVRNCSRMLDCTLIVRGSTQARVAEKRMDFVRLSGQRLPC